MEQQDKFEYKGNNIPFVIKLVWIILISWAVYYLFSYSLPDIKNWLK